MLRRLCHRIGRRGAILLYLTAVAILQAVVLTQGHPNPLARYAGTIAPLGAWAALWAVAGIVAGINAFRLHDRYGFAAAGAISVLWSIVAFGAYFTGAVSWAYRPAAIWLGVAGMTLVVSTWPEHVGGRDDKP